jgi:dTDP-4-amino-4,6-dideoxygalactose transaminase
MKIPYVGLRKQHESLKNEILNAISKVLDHSIFIFGEEVKVFEDKFEKYCNVKHAIGVNSGTDALFFALKTIGIKEGDEVITVPNSFLASTSSIIEANAKPVLVDVKEDLNINPDLIESAITKNTKAIIPVHLTGKPADMSRIIKIAEDHELYIIEDAAQAIGAEYNDKKVGSFGIVNCFSLHPLKNLNACGDGGALTTNNEDIYNKLLQMRNIGLKNRDEADIWGYNSRLDTIQAAILNVKFKYLDKWIDKRRENAKYYNEHLNEFVNVPIENSKEKCVYHTYIIQSEERDALKQFLEKNGIETKIHYPIPIHLQKAARNLGYQKGDFPMTEKLTNEILTLPIYPELTKEELAYIVQKIKEFFKK